MKEAIEIRKGLRRYEKSQVHTGEGLTEQSHKDECDMNYILKEYTKTGYIRHAKENEGRYDDISVQDFQDAMFKVAEANNLFNALPAGIRKEFGQDPAAFLGFVQNPDNAGRLQELGIIHGNDGVDINGVKTDAPVPPPVEPEKGPENTAEKKRKKTLQNTDVLL